MAALAYEGPNLTWQRIAIRLANASPAAKWAFQSLRKWLSTQKPAQSLAFYTFTDAQLTTAGGVLIGTGTPKLYAVYVNKTGTSGTGTSTKSYVKVADDATDDTTSGTQRLVLPLLPRMTRHSTSTRRRVRPRWPLRTGLRLVRIPRCSAPRTPPLAMRVLDLY